MNKGIAVIIALLAVTSLDAQAWTKEKGKGFYKADFSTIKSEMAFNAAGEIVDAPKMSNDIISFYGEHGLLNKLTLAAYVPYVSNSIDNAKNRGLGDIDVSLTYGILNSGVAVSITGLVGIPTGDNTTPTLLNTGDGELNQMIRVNAGTGGTKWWTQAGVGFNNRNKDYSDELRLSAEIGYKFLNERLLTMLKFSGVQSLENGNRAPNTFGLYSNDVQYMAPAIEIMFKATNKLGISLRGAGAGTGATNVQAAPQVSASVFLDIR